MISAAELFDLARHYRQPRLRRLRLCIPGGQLRRQDLIAGLELCHPCAQRSQLREIQDLRRAGCRLP
jgi:hypothetical protein